jgi:hypothetical protein
MEQILERVNQFLEQHSLVVENPLGDVTDSTMNLTVKVKITGTKPMISVGEWKNHIEYTLYLEDIDSEIGRKYFNIMFIGGDNYKLSNTDTMFFRLRQETNKVLNSFLSYWSINDRVICTRIINNLAESQPKNITEELIVEGKYDNIVRSLVKDVIMLRKHNKEGEFVLPEDINGDMTYSFPDIDSNLTINLSLGVDESVDSVAVDGEYYYDDDSISISIVTNPKLNKEILEELHFELNEIIRHELEHVIQYESGYNFPKKEPKVPLKYYTQPHELSAQIAGFKRRARKERRPLEDVIRDWFIKYPEKHRLSPKNVEKVINRLIELS